LAKAGGTQHVNVDAGFRAAIGENTVDRDRGDRSDPEIRSPLLNVRVLHVAHLNVAGGARRFLDPCNDILADRAASTENLDPSSLVAHAIPPSLPDRGADLHY
jgi:hypothetical protein